MRIILDSGEEINLNSKYVVNDNDLRIEGYDFGTINDMINLIKLYYPYLYLPKNNSDKEIIYYILTEDFSFLEKINRIKIPKNFVDFFMKLLNFIPNFNLNLRVSKGKEENTSVHGILNKLKNDNIKYFTYSFRPVYSKEDYPDEEYSLKENLSRGPGYNLYFLKKILDENGWKDNSQSKDVDLSFGMYYKFDLKDYKYEEDFYNIKAKLKNVMKKQRNFGNRNNLRINIRKYLPKTYNIYDRITKEGVYIVKKENTLRQQGIALAKDLKSLRNIQKDNKSDGIIMEYIKNPLLTKDGYKIHFRCYLVFHYISENNIKVYFYDKYFRIYAALEKYKQDDWENKNIHVSGNRPEQQLRYQFPESFDLDKEEVDLIRKSIKKACTEIAEKFIKYADIYKEEYNSGFIIVSPDILIEDKYPYNPWILEINESPGYQMTGYKDDWNEYNDKFSKDFFEFVSNIIFSYFGLRKSVQPIYEIMEDKYEFISQEIVLTKDDFVIFDVYENNIKIGEVQYHQGSFNVSDDKFISPFKDFIYRWRNKFTDTY